MFDDYEGFKKNILSLTGIDLNSYKERQMKRRIDTLANKLGFKDYDSYYKDLKMNADHRKQFMNYLTINVSEFYRNPGQWNTLRDNIIPNLLKSGNGELKIWSAACSTGDEPYTIVMMLKEHFSKVRFSLTATDLDDLVIAFAKEGNYSQKSVAGLPKEYLNKYFTKNSDGTYQISKEVISKVNFKQHNLLSDRYDMNYDLIVCRNVLIYFTEEAKLDIFKRYYQSLRPEGYLFIGSTEQIIQAKEIGYELQHSFFYKKKI